MTTLQISLPDDLKQFIEEQAVRSGCSTPSAYVEALIEEAHRVQSEKALERELLKGLDSGTPTDVDDAYWTKVGARNRVRLRLQSLRRMAKNAFDEIDRGEFEIVDPENLDEFIAKMDAKSRASKTR